MKYYYKLNSDGTIKSLHISKKVAKNGVVITKAQYDFYLSVLNSIPQKDGYIAEIKLYVDGTYTVEYIPIAED